MDIYKKLEKLAYEKTIPFCYSCYKEAPTGICTLCQSDDLMNLLPGVGPEFGTSWVVEHILAETLNPINIDDAFEDMIRSCYEETLKVGWMELDTVDTMKNADPICWDIARGEWLDAEEQDDLIMTFDNGSSYYYMSDIEELLDKCERRNEKVV